MVVYSIPGARMIKLKSQLLRGWQANAGATECDTTWGKFPQAVPWIADDCWMVLGHRSKNLDAIMSISLVEHS
ncbi:MAG: hypothetical protein EBX66_08290 [Betaproteobacteria bacterium]|nr:hypothetical protein [Betaproteobacteria bacterium]